MAKSEGIADLSYRHYTGELEPPRRRWLTIAKVGAKKAVKNRAVWVLSALSAWSYLLLISILYFLDQMAQSAAAAGGEMGMRANPAEEIYSRLIWKDQFLTALGTSQFLWMIITLIIGAGAIANDNRSNALLVYLSKPCTKLDYLKGKFLGIAGPLFLVQFVPTAFFFFYGAMNFRERGFLTADPWMGPKLLVCLIISSVFYAALMIGFSSMTKQARTAGSILAGVYFLGWLFTSLIAVVAILPRVPDEVKRFAENASYWSVDGLMKGVMKIVLDTNGSVPFARRGAAAIIPKPEAWLTFGLVGIVIGLMLWIAWTRIRAVEVVK